MMMMSTERKALRLLFVDDHEVARVELSRLLDMEDDICVVGQACDGLEAVEQARALKPDVILMDFSMPRMNGVEATSIIHSEFPEIRIIGLSMYDEADLAAAMQRVGAVAYLSKSGDPDALLDAIRGEAGKAE